MVPAEGIEPPTFGLQNRTSYPHQWGSIVI